MSKEVKEAVASGTVKEAERDAEEVLLTVWAKGAKTFALPVDPVKIALEYEIETYEVELDVNVSGAIVKEGQAAPFILLNQADPETRKRFSCAHELGHFVRRLNSLQVDEDFEYVDFRGPLATAGTSEEEIYANNFAATLLMPAAQVEQYANETPASLAYVFQVSAESIENRLKNLRLK